MRIVIHSDVDEGFEVARLVLQKTNISSLKLARFGRNCIHIYVFYGARGGRKRIRMVRKINKTKRSVIVFWTEGGSPLNNDTCISDTHRLFAIDPKIPFFSEVVFCSKQQLEALRELLFPVY